ncbi:hypothetical protein [Streptomyces sp. NPDC051567]|uniref:hypothetical protein n=1 Tax=Streptomyces sp. NPDC051567 TaxID=3365660 RepID=UPI0037BA5434
MRARRSRAVSLLVAAVALTAILAPGGLAGHLAGEHLAGERPTGGPGAAAPAPAAGRADTGGAGPGRADGGLAEPPAELPAEPPVQPRPPTGAQLFGADCDTEIDGSQVTAHCHNGYPRTDLLRLHVECDRWWDVDVDGAAVALDPAGRTELVGRCWKEVRSAWVSHRRP